jgi:hypothetical protein
MVNFSAAAQCFGHRSSVANIGPYKVDSLQGEMRHLRSRPLQNPDLFSAAK